MKKLLSIIGILYTSLTVCSADVTLGNRCEAFLPDVFMKHSVIYQADADMIAESQDYGQNVQPTGGKHYWIAYSDRENNTTYQNPSKASGIYSHLRFNEKVRIARIEKGYALVYREPAEVSNYPNISSNAEPRGWIPMSNLLLWTTCPTDEKGIYKKALLAANIDANNKVADMGRVYSNPATRAGETRMKTDMNIYFIMKRAENGLVLLSSQYSLNGTSDQMLYGWVSESSYIRWNQRSCLEPTWNLQDVNYFKGSQAVIYADPAKTRKAAAFTYGRSLNEDEKAGSPTQYRLPKESLRFPILDNDMNDTTVYKCTTFGMVGGSLNAAIDARAANLKDIEKVLGKIQNMNLIIVIDGTKSMEPYYAPVKEAIKMGADFIRKGYTFKVGVVIFRDYADGQYMTEYLPMVSKDDARLAKFLDNGGEYHIKSSPKDKTKEEALYQGISLALDHEKMGYRPDESNLMVVIGDCGNDDSDNAINPDELAKKMVADKMNLMTFQVCRENQEAYLGFNQQMRTLMMSVVRAQYQKLSASLKPKMQVVADGYDLRSNLSDGKSSSNEYFVFAARQADDGHQMPAGTLAILLKNSLADFADAVQARIDNVANGGRNFDYNVDTRDDLEAEVDSAFYVEMIGYERFLELKKTNSMSAFTGYTDKRDKSGREYWKPILYISADEFNDLIQRLEPVNRIAQEKSDDRKGYVEAMKALLRSIVPDITEEELDRKSIGEVMALISGLNESSAALKGPSLIDIQDPKVVSAAQYYDIVSNFARKYRDLRNIKSKGYRYKLNFNNVPYYWIPMEDMP